MLQILVFLPKVGHQKTVTPHTTCSQQPLRLPSHTKWDTNDLKLGTLGFSNPQFLSDHSILIGDMSSFAAGIARWFSWDTFDIQTHRHWVKKRHFDFLSDNIQNPPVAFSKSAFLQMSLSSADFYMRWQHSTWNLEVQSNCVQSFPFKKEYRHCFLQSQKAQHI